MFVVVFFFKSGNHLILDCRHKCPPNSASPTGIRSWCMRCMHGRMHPNYCQITILLVIDLCSSLAYFMMIQPLPIADKLPIKLWLLGNYQQTRVHMCTCAHIHTSTYNPTPNSHTLHMCMYVNTQHTYACTC